MSFSESQNPAWRRLDAYHGHRQGRVSVRRLHWSVSEHVNGPIGPALGWGRVHGCTHGGRRQAGWRRHSKANMPSISSGMKWVGCMHQSESPRMGRKAPGRRALCETHIPCRQSRAPHPMRGPVSHLPSLWSSGLRRFLHLNLAHASTPGRRGRWSSGEIFETLRH